MVKLTAARAGVNAATSPHWLRHAHGSHTIEKGASLHEVQATLGHANIGTTRGYLHARPRERTPPSPLHMVGTSRSPPAWPTCGRAASRPRDACPGVSAPGAQR